MRAAAGRRDRLDVQHLARCRRSRRRRRASASPARRAWPGRSRGAAPARRAGPRRPSATARSRSGRKPSATLIWLNRVGGVEEPDDVLAAGVVLVAEGRVERVLVHLDLGLGVVGVLGGLVEEDGLGRGRVLRRPCQRPVVAVVAQRQRRSWPGRGSPCAWRGRSRTSPAPAAGPGSPPPQCWS